MKCNSCKKEFDKGGVKFKCPACGKFEIIRCDSCRKLAAKYVCEKCGFSGPN